MLVQVTEQGKHFLWRRMASYRPVGVGGCGYMCGVGSVTRKGKIMPQKVCQKSLIRQQHKLPGRKALEPLDSNGKDKRSTSPEPQFSHLQDGNQPCSVWAIR